MKLNKNKIQLIKARNNLTTRDIAERYGCTRSFINYVIQREKVRTETAGKLAAALGVDVLDIIELESGGKDHGQG